MDEYNIAAFVTHESTNQYNVRKEQVFDAESSYIAKKIAYMFWCKLGYIVHSVECIENNG